jgi:hypothetical protein
MQDISIGTEIVNCMYPNLATQPNAFFKITQIIISVAAQPKPRFPILGDFFSARLNRSPDLLSHEFQIHSVRAADTQEYEAVTQGSYDPASQYHLDT